MSGAPLRLLVALFCVFTFPAGDGQAARLRCDFSVSDIDFGTIDVLSGVPFHAVGSFAVDCTGDPGADVTVCPNFGSGTGNPQGYDPRQMSERSDSSLKLDYNLFWPSGTAIWGSLAWPFPPRPPIFHLRLDPSGRAFGQWEVRATVFGAQQDVVPGSYRSRLKRGHILEWYTYGTDETCLPDRQRRRRGFTVRAEVATSCLVTATDLDFGATGRLDAPVDAASTVTVRCSRGAAYSIGIDGGQSGTTDPAAREMRKGGEHVLYGIYRDAARTQGWGGQPGQRVNGIGNGTDQAYTAYGRVHAQSTPSAGTYTDTLVVRVEY